MQRHTLRAAGLRSFGQAVRSAVNPLRKPQSSANAARGGLKPPPAGRLRRAYLHHPNSTNYSASDHLPTHRTPFTVRDTRHVKVFTVKSNQPLLRQELRRLPWAQAPGTRRRGRGHGRTESRSIKVIDLEGTTAQALFPHARRAIKVIRRRRVGAGRPSVEIVYAITSLDHRAADPRLLAA